MANINLDFATITNVSMILTAAYNDLSPQIMNLKTTVDAMLQKDGGLWMKSTSPAFQQQYDDFNASAVNVVNAIASFSSMFAGLASDMQKMDSDYAFQILHPSAGS